MTELANLLAKLERQSDEIMQDTQDRRDIIMLGKDYEGADVDLNILITCAQLANMVKGLAATLHILTEGADA